jgi:hypothetical protein
MVTLTTFQVLYSHTCWWAELLHSERENLSTSTEGSSLHSCSRAKSPTMGTAGAPVLHRDLEGQHWGPQSSPAGRPPAPKHFHCFPLPGGEHISLSLIGLSSEELQKAGTSTFGLPQAWVYVTLFSSLIFTFVLQWWHCSIFLFTIMMYGLLLK